MPLLAGGAMLAASYLPWLIDPLGQTFPAWQLPVDIGWQLRSDLFSYGLLCLFCALYAFFIAYLCLHRDRAGPCPNRVREIYCDPLGMCVLPTGERGSALSLRRHSILAGLLCLVPIGVFFTQYLFVDMGSMALLARHEFQSLFIQGHFGYHTAAQFIPLRPDTLDPSTLNGRLALLLDQIQPGLYLPFLGAFCLIRGQRNVGTGLAPVRSWMAYVNQTGRDVPSPCVFGQGPALSLRCVGQMWKCRRVVILICFVLLLIVLGRGPAALACRFQAEHLLATGDYGDVLVWLDRAAMLNPSLDQLSAYHIERGQAWYYLHPTQLSIESQIYLAATYLKQNDYLSAYQTLMVARQQSLETPAPSWLVAELSITVTKLAEMQHPLNGAPEQRVHKDLPSIVWLNTLIRIDPNNVYAHYTLGRVEYDIHDFTACEEQMLSVITLSYDPDIRSTAYTYLAWSSES